MIELGVGGNATARIARTLARQIETGELPQGTTLPSERALAASFDASRPTVHQAVQLLARQGYVRIQDGRRPQVSLPQPESLGGFEAATVASVLTLRDGRANLEQMRQLIEVGAVRLIARSGSMTHVGKLHTYVVEGERAESAEQFVAADLAFHRALLSCIENPIILNLYDSFVPKLFQMRVNLAGTKPRWSSVLAQHRSIVDAIQRRDDLGAVLILEEHLVDAYRSSLDNPLAKSPEEEK